MFIYNSGCVGCLENVYRIVFLQHLDNCANNVWAQYSYVLNIFVHIRIIAVIWTSLLLNVCDRKFTDRKKTTSVIWPEYTSKMSFEYCQKLYQCLPILTEDSKMFILMKNMQVSKYLLTTWTIFLFSCCSDKTFVQWLTSVSTNWCIVVLYAGACFLSQREQYTL